MSKVLLVNPSYNFPVKHEMYPSGALLLLGTMAKQRGHEVKLVHMVADKMLVANVVQLARDFNADVVGITVNTFQVATVKKLLSELRWYSKARLVIGGAHPTSVGIEESRKEFPDTDDIVIGEGEHQFTSLLDNSGHYTSQDLEYITPPDLTLVDLSKFAGAYPLGKTPAMFMMASRGCIGTCLPDSEKVLMSDGITTKPISELQIGDNVVSMNNFGEKTISRVSTIRQTPARSDIIKITTDEGRILRCTADHRIMSTLGWVEAGSLRIGDSVALWNVRINEKRDDKIGIPCTVETKSQDATRTCFGARKENCQATTLDKQSNEESYQRRKEQIVATFQCYSNRTSKTKNVGEQSDEMQRNQRESQPNKKKRPQPSFSIYKEYKKCQTSTDDGCTKIGTQRENETPQSHAEQRRTRQSKCIASLAYRLRPEKLLGAMVPKENWTKRSGKTTRGCAVPPRIQVCGRREVLDRTVPERKVSKPRLYMEDWGIQDSHTLQFNILAQSTKLQRHRSNTGLHESRLGRICSNRANDEGYTSNSAQDTGMVSWSKITNIATEPVVTVYDIETTPHHNFIASGFVVHNCTFCNRSIFGNKVRYRSPENVLRELRYFAGYGIKEVFIQDDTFNLNHAWYEEILQRIIDEGLNKKMIFRAPFRADEKLVSEKVLKLAKEAGFWLLFYGVESGNQGMLDRMHKRLSLDEIERAVRLTKETGIKVETSFIVGLPGETPRTIDDTLDFYDKLSPFWSGCGVAIPFPSTEVSKEVHEQIKDIPYSEYYPGRVYFHTDIMSCVEIKDAHKYLGKAMTQDKITNMMAHPNMLLRTIKDRVR